MANYQPKEPVFPYSEGITERLGREIMGLDTSLDTISDMSVRSVGVEDITLLEYAKALGNIRARLDVMIGDTGRDPLEILLEINNTFLDPGIDFQTKPPQTKEVDWAKIALLGLEAISMEARTLNDEAALSYQYGWENAYDILLGHDEQRAADL